MLPLIRTYTGPRPIYETLVTQFLARIVILLISLLGSEEGTPPLREFDGSTKDDANSKGEKDKDEDESDGAEDDEEEFLSRKEKQKKKNTQKLKLGEVTVEEGPVSALASRTVDADSEARKFLQSQVGAYLIFFSRTSQYFTMSRVS